MQFYGREEELGALREGLRALSSDKPRQLIALGGEAGIGKTRLVQEFCLEAHETGAIIMWGHCEEDGPLPYQPFLEALGGYVASCPEDVLRSLVEGRSSLVRLLPELAIRLPDLPAPIQIDPENERPRLFADLASLLGAVSRYRPAILVLDDLHWGDQSSWLLLRHLLAPGQSGGLILVATYRDMAVSRGHPLLSLMAELRRYRILTRLQIGGLSERAVSQLVRGWKGTLSGRPAKDIFELTEGNPFFVEEVLRHAPDATAGGGEGRRANRRVGTGEAEVPEGIRDIISDHLSRLTAACRALVQAAAVLGKEFDLSVLQAMAEAEGDFVSSMEEAVGQGIVAEPSPDARVSEFVHVIVRHAIYDELSEIRRRDLHLRAASALEAIWEHNLARQAGAIAGHYTLAGSMAPIEKVVAALDQAAEAAASVYAYEEAAGYWRRAVELLQDNNPALLGGILEGLADLHLVAEPAETSGSEFTEQALLIYERAGLNERAAQMHSRLAMYYASLVGPVLDVNRALGHATAAQAFLEHMPERAPLGYTYVGLAVAQAMGRSTSEGAETARRALDLARRVGNPSLALNATAWLALFELVIGHAREAETLMEQAVAAASRVAMGGVGMLPLVVASNRAFGAFISGDLPEAVRLLERDLAVPAIYRAPSRRRLLENLLQLAHAETGGPLEGARGFDVLSVEAHRLYRHGDWEQAVEVWREALRQDEARGDLWNQFWRCLWLSRAFYKLRDLEEAEEMATRATAIAESASYVVCELWARPLLARILVDRDRVDQAEEQVQRCRDLVQDPSAWNGLAGHLALAEAALAGVRGDSEACDRHMRTAIEVFERFQLLWDEAEAYIVWTRIGAQGRPASSREAEAARIYRGLKASRRWLTSLTPQAVSRSRRPAAQRSPYPNALTSREVEVLKLIAMGKSNQQIADELVISLNTASRHVSNILAKASVANRTEAAAFARDAGLI